MISSKLDDQAILRECRQILERNSKSFALAARLLSPLARDRAAAVYAFCRRVDDAIDDTDPVHQPRALEQLQRELARLYAGDAFEEAALLAFQAVVKQCTIPPRYPRELIEGMAMDVCNQRYETLDDLLLYCHRVAGVVGLMMCHVFGLSRDAALLNAAHLGLAMQLTNICRDVREDWALGRLYLPRHMLRQAGAAELPDVVAGPFPSDLPTLRAMQSVTRELLREAEQYYLSAAQGLDALPFRAGWAVRAAAMLYREIGAVVSSHDHDPRAARAIVTLPRKLRLVAQATTSHALTLPKWLSEHRKVAASARSPRRELMFPEDILGRRTATYSSDAMLARARPELRLVPS